LEAEADLSETALPVAVREIFSKGLLRRLSYGEHSAFAIKRVSQAFGQHNFNAFVAPALTRALGEDTHLDTVASAARRAEISQDDDDIVTPAAAVAAAEGSACKGGWSLTPMRRRIKITHSEDVRETSASTRRDFSRESGAVAALKATLPLFDRATLLATLFPVFPAPPGPLLRILLAPAPCPALCVAAAELVAAAAKRLAPDDAFKRALPRLKPLFAVASSISRRFLLRCQTNQTKRRRSTWR
jgi:Arc/MetJ family transcription regulator